MGLLLILIPWSAFWDRNYFSQAGPALHDLIVSNYARGAISGLGLVNVYAALVALGELFGSRAPADALPPAPDGHDRA